MGHIIEGIWEDLVSRHNLHGHKVRVFVLEEGGKGSEDPWLKSLREWAEGHKRPEHFADDSRQSIYSGTVDDPR